MIYLFYGQDFFSIQKAIKKITSAKDLEVNYFNGDMSSFVNSLLSTSFFVTKRVFILKSYLEKIGTDDEKKLVEGLKKTPEDTLVVFIEDKEPKGEIKKLITKEGKIKSFNKPTERDLISYINKRVSEEGSRIAPLAAERLASFVGPDYWQLEEEIKKLTLYKLDDPQEEGIQASDVDLLVKSGFEANIFELMDAISTKNQRKSIKLLSQFLESGENEIYILSMIAKQFRNIAMAKFEDNINESSFAKKANIHPYVAKKSIAQSRNFEKPEIIKIYNKIKEADLALKSGGEPKHTLESIFI